LAGSQLSVVQGLASSHLAVLPATQAEAAHWLSLTHRLSAVQGAVLAVCWQAPVLGSQLSSVQTLPSLQSFCTPPQDPPLQVSALVQALPSSQLPLLNGAKMQVPLALVQLSAVQTLPSVQLIAAPLHLPALHTSPVVHRLLSSQVPANAV
jgi:hypothetical protein